MAKTRAEIKEHARFLLDEVAEGWLKDTATGEYGLDNAVEDALREFAIKTHCYLASYTANSVAGTSTYIYDGTTFTGSRLFDLRYVAFDSNTLDFKTVDELDQLCEDWRFEGNGTPKYWIPWGARTIKLYNTPDTASAIYVEGWETHDPADFDADSDEPPGLTDEDADVLPYGAAVMVLIRGVGMSETQMRGTMIADKWNSGLQAANRRLHKGHLADTQVGKWAEYQRSEWPRYDNGITNI